MRGCNLLQYFLNLPELQKICRYESMMCMVGGMGVWDV